LNQSLDFTSCCVGQIRHFVLCVCSQQQDLVVLRNPLVDDANASALAVAFSAPPNLPGSAGTANDITGVRFLHQVKLEPVELDVAETGVADPRKQRRFNEFHLK
jgi:hypothetical protein